MTPEQWEQVTELFEAALQCDPAAREDLLARAAIDDVMRAEVESLLAEHERAGDFLKNPANIEAASALYEVSQGDPISAEHDPYLGMTLANRYYIEDRLARGGQALVYRARDMVVMSKLVVVKILRTPATENNWLRKRLQQEMEALSRIDHPGIVGVLDTGELPEGAPYLILQYVDGVTLRQEMENGPLDPVRVAAILRQIGAALEAAHGLGIAHRDLKPENIMLQRLSDGSELVKLIDFGIAKVEKSALEPSATTVMVAGTVRYMAPEQFQGENSSASDIYALGLIACEMLTGQPDIHILEARRKIRDLIRPALAYRPQDRPNRASKFSNKLAEALGETLKEEAPPRVVVLTRARLAWLIAVLLLASLAAVSLLYFGNRSSEMRAVRLSLAVPDGTTFGSFAVSPDGRRIAVVGADSAGKTQLWVRSLASATFQPLAGTEGASSPFWSADGRLIGFFADGKLKKIEASGGPPQTICRAEVGSYGGAWNRDGVILFTLNPATPLYRVSAAGGEPTPVTSLDASAEESSHGWPQFLPDGRHFLFFVDSAQLGRSGIYVGSPDSTIRTRVLAAGSSALYSSGHLLFVREQTLMAQPFDAVRLQITHEALPVAENVGIAVITYHSLFSVSDGGVLAYESSGRAGYSQLLWFDRAGKKLGVVTSASGQRSYSNVNLSPDGTRIAADRQDSRTATRDIWLFDLTRGIESRLTFAPGTNASPVWSPDGSRLIFFSTRDGVWNLYQRFATGAGDAELLLKSNQSKITEVWCPGFGRTNPAGVGLR